MRLVNSLFENNFPLQVSGRGQHRFQGSEPKVIMGLVTQLVVAKLEQSDYFPAQLLSTFKPLGEQQDLSYKSAIRLYHCELSEQLF